MSCFLCQINHRANDIITHGFLKRLAIKNTTHERNLKCSFALKIHLFLKNGCSKRFDCKEQLLETRRVHSK